MGRRAHQRIVEATDSLTVLFKYDVDYLDSGGYPASSYTERFKNYPYGSSTPNPHYSDLFHISANAPQTAIDRFQRAILKVDYVFPDGITLRSVSGYQYGNTNWVADMDGTDYGSPATGGTSSRYWTIFDHVDETIYSQEFNVISPDNQRVTWVLGAFGQSDIYNFPYTKYAWEVPPINPLPPHGPVLGNPAYIYTLWGNTPQVSFAGFGQISVNIIDGLQAQFGARYTTHRSTNDACWIQYGFPVCQNSVVAKSNAVTYKGSLNWSVNDNNFLYAFIATGYKPGGINAPIYANSILVVPFAPEKVTEYEVGWKAALFDGHLRTMVDGYYNTYRNFIVSVAYPGAPYGAAGYVTEVNDPKSTIVSGVEAQADAVFGNLSFGAGLGLMHSSLGGLFAADARFNSAIPCDPSTGIPAIYGGGAYGACINLKGHSLPYAPSVTYDMYVQYQFDLENGDSLTPRVSYAHQGPQWASIFDQPQFGDQLSARDLVNAQIAWKHDTYMLTLYSTNLTDQHYVAALMSPLDFAGPPRQYGIRLLKAF